MVCCFVYVKFYAYTILASNAQCVGPTGATTVAVSIVTLCVARCRRSYRGTMNTIIIEEGGIQVRHAVVLANRKGRKLCPGCENLLSKTFNMLCATCDKWSCYVCVEQNLKHCRRCYLACKRRQLQRDQIMLAYPLLCLQ